jgi:hypothetical protein
MSLSTVYMTSNHLLLVVMPMKTLSNEYLGQNLKEYKHILEQMSHPPYALPVWSNARAHFPAGSPASFMSLKVFFMVSRRLHLKETSYLIPGT